MRGTRVSHVWRGHGSALFLEFGDLTDTVRRDGTPGNPAGEFGLMIEWDWRIEEGHSILCGSCSDEELWEPAFKRLIGCEVVDVSVFGRLPEITISLAGDLHVASLMTAEGDPEWALFNRRGGSSPLTIHSRDGEVRAAEARTKVSK
jgi:hypothetical protein